MSNINTKDELVRQADQLEGFRGRLNTLESNQSYIIGKLDEIASKLKIPAYDEDEEVNCKSNKQSKGKVVYETIKTYKYQIPVSPYTQPTIDVYLRMDEESFKIFNSSEGNSILRIEVCSAKTNKIVDVVNRVYVTDLEEGRYAHLGNISFSPRDFTGFAVLPDSTKKIIKSKNIKYESFKIVPYDIGKKYYKIVMTKDSYESFKDPDVEFIWGTLVDTKTNKELQVKQFHIISDEREFNSDGVIFTVDDFKQVTGEIEDGCYTEDENYEFTDGTKLGRGKKNNKLIWSNKVTCFVDKNSEVNIRNKYNKYYVRLGLCFYQYDAETSELKVYDRLIPDDWVIVPVDKCLDFKKCYKKLFDGSEDEPNLNEKKEKWLAKLSPKDIEDLYKEYGYDKWLEKFVMPHKDAIVKYDDGEHLDELERKDPWAEDTEKSDNMYVKLANLIAWFDIDKIARNIVRVNNATNEDKIESANIIGTNFNEVRNGLYSNVKECIESYIKWSENNKLSESYNFFDIQRGRIHFVARFNCIDCSLDGKWISYKLYWADEESDEGEE